MVSDACAGDGGQQLRLGIDIFFAGAGQRGVRSRKADGYKGVKKLHLQDERCCSENKVAE